MGQADQRLALEWRDGVPVAQRFDDPYFSLQNGLDETRHVFLAGNNLPDRFRPGFHVAELGFGTGLNCLATLAAWRSSGVEGQLRYTSFELYPMERADRLAALRLFPELADLAGEMAASMPADLDLAIVEGDARRTLPKWAGKADAWFLDGFSPAKNPELWEPALMGEIFRHTAEGGTAATYSAAGHVRRNLAEAGFRVTRRAGFGRKRHMTVAERA